MDPRRHLAQPPSLDIEHADVIICFRSANGIGNEVRRHADEEEIGIAKVEIRYDAEATVLTAPSFTATAFKVQVWVMLTASPELIGVPLLAEGFEPSVV